MIVSDIYPANTDIWHTCNIAL